MFAYILDLFRFDLLICAFYNLYLYHVDLFSGAFFSASSPIMWIVHFNIGFDMFDVRALQSIEIIVEDALARIWACFFCTCFFAWHTVLSEC